jgi:mannose-6-phosphate isomerase
MTGSLTRRNRPWWTALFGASVKPAGDLAVIDPICFHPWLRPLVWGGRSLAEVLGKALPTEGPHGESWEISDHPGHRSIVAAGPHAGLSLRDLMERHSTALLGPVAGRHQVFPWLIKYLDARDWLSVQVHPDEESVQLLWPGERSKTEAWFVLDALPEGRIYAGLKPGVDETTLRRALGAGAVVECLHPIRPMRGDCLFLPAGTIHAVGGGVLLAEVQQTSDATFRLYDWDRRDAQGQPRALHVEQALACLNWPQGPVQPITVPDRDRCHQRLVHCRYFDLDYLRQTGPFEIDGGQLQALLVLHGQGQIQGRTIRHEVQRGSTLLLPAGCPGVTCIPEGEMELLLVSLPDE